ncbi:MAG: IS3 family transposase [Firmicutes bacterium]|nr:IS3 family transposase [Bacillota bacterium]
MSVNLEIIHWQFYKTREEARQRIFEYIEVFYNCQRAQKRLGYLSPIKNGPGKRPPPPAA